jgi:hypothetical protein
VAGRETRQRGAWTILQNRRVLGRDAEHVYQDLGRGDTVKHRTAALPAHLPDVETIREVKYRAGGVRIALQRDTGKEKEK